MLAISKQIKKLSCLRISTLMLILVSFPSFAQTFEAESGTLANGADIQNCDACSSQEMVGKEMVYTNFTSSEASDCYENGW